MSEWFDYYDEQMKHLGSAPREEVHRKGLWHQTFHCWVMQRREDGDYVWFQQRQIDKDTHPGRLDITAAGHLNVGETVSDGVRELEEELGLRAEFSELVKLGEHREQVKGALGGMPFIDRELSHVFGYVCAQPLSSLQLQAEEVAGIYEASLDEMIALFEGGLSSVTACGAVADSNRALRPVSLDVRTTDFVPRETAYYVGVFRSLKHL